MKNIQWDLLVSDAVIENDIYKLIIFNLSSHFKKY